MITRLQIVLACGLLLSLGACVESEHPIAEISDSQQDPRLYGLWSHTNAEGETSYIVIGAEESEPLDASRGEVEAGLMRYWSVTQNAQTHVVRKPEGTRFFRTRIGEDDFANWITPPDEANKDRPVTYFFVKYRAEPKQLSIWIQDPEVTAQAIEAGQLKGIVQRKAMTIGLLKGELESVKITDSSENIKSFLAAGGGASCFPDKNKIVYARVR